MTEINIKRKIIEKNKRKTDERPTKEELREIKALETA